MPFETTEVMLHYTTLLKLRLTELKMCPVTITLKKIVWRNQLGQDYFKCLPVELVDAAPTKQLKLRTKVTSIPVTSYKTVFRLQTMLRRAF